MPAELSTGRMVPCGGRDRQRAERSPTGVTGGLVEGRVRSLYPLGLSRRVPGPASWVGPDSWVGVEHREPLLDSIIQPILFYALCAMGAVGVVLALPRRSDSGPGSPQLVGGLIAGTAGGLVILALTLAAREHFPNVYFYIFSVVALGASLRVITHPRPVYAALYFILTIIATAGLLLILSGEFVSFALVIVYAGAILITYLFVIMLATQAPTEAEEETSPDYDASAREPVSATVAGFVILAALSTMMFRGVEPLNKVRPDAAAIAARDNAVLARMPLRLERVLREEGLIAEDESLARESDGGFALDAATRTAKVVNTTTRAERTVSWPAELSPRNVESLGFNLLADHPGSIEIAGVILLMAMLGAVVLSRKQVQLDEDLKARQARRLAERSALAGGPESGSTSAVGGGEIR